MKTTKPHDLLRAYTQDHSESAFQELVHRYVDLVYSAAIRRVSGDRQLAEDATQEVFTDLARKAAALPANVTLGGWLLRHTGYVASTAMRGDQRRRDRERQAVEMNALNETSGADWSQFAPMLDDAMDEMDAVDRDALVLRYFEQRDLRSVGEALGTTEDAAQKRVSRALEKLHVLLKQRGGTLSAAALGTALATEAVTAAPAGLAGAVTAAALSGTTVTTAAVIAATKGIAMTTLQKTMVCATVAGLAGAGIYEAHQTAQLRDRVQALQRQQAPLTEQIQELQRQREEATQQLVSLQASQPLELLRLRNQVGLLRHQTNALAQQLNENRSKEQLAKESDAAAKPIPCDSCTFSGYATPEAALQTYAWALTKGNLQAYLDCFAPEGRDEAAKEFQGKSDAEILGMLIGKLHSAGALRLDRKQTLEDGSVAFPLNSTTMDTGLNVTTVTAMIRFRSVAGEWRLSGTSDPSPGAAPK